MDRQAFKQRMQNLKSYRENNPGKGYWDWKVETFADGGVNDNLVGSYSNHTGTPTMYVPVTKEYEAVPEGFGEIANVHTPEVTITPQSNISLTVTRSFQRQVDANDLRRDLENNNRRRVLEEYSDQRNRTYELLNTPEARRRAQIIDRKYGTEYNKVYDDLTKEYEDINSYVNLPEPNFVSNKKDYANIDPSKSKTINLSTDNIKTAEDYPKGLIRHEIGHYVDEKAYPGGVPNNAYLRQLGKPSKYRSFSEVEHMFPDKDRAKSVYEYLRKPTEKKSIMNQFDEYLMNTLTPSTYPTNTKQFRQVIESAPDLYNNMKMLLKIHTKPSVLYKDFLARPLVNKINKNKNQEIV